VTRLEVIRPFVEQTVREFLGVDELKVMEDGTIPIRAGSSAVNVRLLEGPPGGHPLLRIASPMLHDVTPSRELLEKLNEMNAAFSFARVFAHRGADRLCVRSHHVRGGPLGRRVATQLRRGDVLRRRWDHRDARSSDRSRAIDRLVDPRRTRGRQRRRIPVNDA
jgi:T3SS (YopN, CesT) and YbjN peptide-binding chaperone 1